MRFRNFRRCLPAVPTCAGLTLVVAAASIGLTASSARANGHHGRRVVLVPAAPAREVVREVYREVERPATRTIIIREVVRQAETPREAAPTPQAEKREAAPPPPPAKATTREADDDDATTTVVRERYIIREVAPVATRVVTVRTVPVERYVVRSVQAAPTTYRVVTPRRLCDRW